jgi:PDZ domain
MKRFWIIAFLMLRAFSLAGEHDDAKGPPPPIKFPHAPRAWLGLEVSKPDETITAQLPSLPPGIGFVIRVIDKDGPAEAAGLQEFDVLWKIGDQMLVNEGQLAALLRLSKPGDEISVSGFRAGKPLEVKLKLGDAPVSKRPFPDDLVEDSILPGACGWRVRDISIPNKSARYSADEGRAEVRREGDVYKVKIQGPKDEVIYEGDLPTDGNVDQVPEGWRRRVHALRRGLDHALEGRMMPNRQPRPRVVPPSEAKR